VSITDSNLKKGILFSLSTTLVGSLAAATSKYLSTDINPALIVFIQYGLCTLTLLPWLLQTGLKGIKTQHPWYHLIRGTAGWLCFYTYYLAVAKIPLVDASLLRNTAPIFVPFFMLIIFKTPVGLSKMVAIAIGFIGVVLILKPDGSSFSLWHGVGLLSGVTLALSMIYTRELTISEPSNRILFYYFLISFLLSTPLAVIEFKPIPPHLWPGLLFVGLSIFITMTLYNRAYTHASANSLAPFSYSGVIFSGILGWLFWNHTPDARSIIGIALVILGGIISLLFRQRSQHPNPIQTRDNNR